MNHGNMSDVDENDVFYVRSLWDVCDKFDDFQTLWLVVEYNLKLKKYFKFLF
jgi:hypothetical protein